jgi:hypothetical protein
VEDTLEVLRDSQEVVEEEVDMPWEVILEVVEIVLLCLRQEELGQVMEIQEARQEIQLEVVAELVQQEIVHQEERVFNLI